MRKVKAGFSLTESVVNILLVSMLFVAGIPVITGKVKSIPEWGNEDGQIWWATKPVEKGIYYNDNGTVGINVGDDFINETDTDYFRLKGIVMGSYYPENDEDNSFVAYGQYQGDNPLRTTSKSYTFNTFGINGFYNTFMWDSEIAAMGHFRNGTYNGTKEVPEFSLTENINSSSIWTHTPAASYSMGGSGAYSFRGTGVYSCEVNPIHNASGDYAYRASGDFAVSLEGADAQGSYSVSIANDEDHCSVTGDNAVLIGGDYNHAIGGIILGGHHISSNGSGVILGGESPVYWEEEELGETILSEGTFSIDEEYINLITAMDNKHIPYVYTTAAYTGSSNYNPGKALSLRNAIGSETTAIEETYYHTGKTLLGGFSNYAPESIVIGGELNSAANGSIIVGGRLNNASFILPSPSGVALNQAMIIGGEGNYAAGGTIYGGVENLLVAFDMSNNLALGNRNKRYIAQDFSPTSSLLIGNNNKVRGSMNVAAIGNNISAISYTQDTFKKILIGNNLSASFPHSHSDEARIKGTDSGATTAIKANYGTTIDSKEWNSDKRLKKNIKNIDHGLETVLKLNPILFHYHHKKPTDEENGFIAQEIQKIFPEVVYEKDAFLSIDYKQLYEKITMALVNAYKEIFSKTIALEKENKKLNKKLLTLKNKLNKLEGKRYE